jgi:hypothetical protein
MAHGFSVANASGKVLVDSSLSHPHFIGKFTHYSKVSVPDLMDGPGKQKYGPEQRKDMSGMPAKGVIYKFRVTRKSGKDTVPLCFIKPSSVSSSAPYQGIIVTKEASTYSGNLRFFHWDVWVFSSKDMTTAPIIYAFQEIKSMDLSKDHAQAAMGTTHGLKTFNTDGDVTFDSRFLPLRVVGGGTIASVTSAHTGSRGSGLDPNLSVNATEKQETVSEANAHSSGDIIYYCPSIAHACSEFAYNASDKGWRGIKRFSWARSDLWWCFYRAGYRVYKAGGKMYFRANHGVYARGHVWAHTAKSSYVIAIIAGAFFTGGASLALLVGAVALKNGFSSADVGEGAYLPYSNGSRNTGRVGFILSKASYYD